MGLNVSQYFNFHGFPFGLDWTSAVDAIKLGFLKTATNVDLTGTGEVAKRLGCSKLYPTAYTANKEITAVHSYQSPYGTDYLLAACDTKIGYYDSGWKDVVTGQTADKQYSFVNHRGNCIGVNGKDANFIIRDDDGTITSYTMGIAQPTVAPTMADNNPVTPACLSEDFDYADTAALTAGGWTDADSGGVSELSGTDPNSKQGSDGDSKYLRLYGSADGSVDIAKRTRIITVPLEYSMKIELHFDKAGYIPPAWGGGFYVDVYNSVYRLQVVFCGSYVWMHNGLKWVEIWKPAGNNIEDTWYIFDFKVTGTGVDLIVNGQLIGNTPIDNPNTSVDGRIDLACYTKDATYGQGDVYVDNVTITATGDENDTSGLTGLFAYAYAFKRSDEELIGNYKSSMDATDTEDQKILISNSSVNISYTKSADTKVDKIVIYRTLNLINEDNETTQYYKVTEVSNATSTYEDDTPDNDLTTLASSSNTLPPKATYVAIHKDRIFYLNCPDEDDGGSLFMFSKSGKSEACPSSNYQYFDKQDGEDITGGASIGDYFVIFKRNKMAVMEGSFEEWYTVSYTIGCIAPKSIIVVGNVVYFLSEEGWKSFDGVNLMDISTKMQYAVDQGYLDTTTGTEIHGAYSTPKKKFVWISDKSGSRYGYVAHSLERLRQDVSQGEAPGLLFGWTVYEYDFDDTDYFTTIASYKDGSGVTQLAAGTSKGFIYKLDNTEQDNARNYTFTIETGWSSLNTPAAITKIQRKITLQYALGSTGDNSITLKAYVNNSDTEVDSIAISTETGASDRNRYSLNLHTTGTGELFKYHISGTSEDNFSITDLGIAYRMLGIR